MDMTIEEALEILDHMPTDEGQRDAIIMAIDIMHKYQDIQEIVEKWKADTWTDIISYDCMVEISEVME